MYQLRDLRRRIKAVKNIGHITGAMKTLAQAKIRKTEERLKKVQLYSQKMQEILAPLMDMVDPEELPLLVKRPVKKTGLVVMTSDTGFCGSFNHNIINATLDYIKRRKVGEDLYIMAIGRKIISALSRRRIPCELTIPRWIPDISTARVISDKCVDLFLSGRVDRILVLFSKPASGMKLQCYREIFLPMSIDLPKDQRPGDYIIEPNPLEALNGILPQYLVIAMQKLLLETRSGELMARIQSMTNATENAEHLVSELTLLYYRARQESITREIIEITSGAEAMK